MRRIDGQGRGLIQLEASQEPVTAAGLARRREKKVKDAAASGRPEPMDLYQEYPGEGIVKAHCVPQGAWHGAPTLVAFAFSMLGAGATLRQHVLAFVRVCGCRETAKL